MWATRTLEQRQWGRGPSAIHPQGLLLIKPSPKTFLGDSTWLPGVNALSPGLFTCPRASEERACRRLLSPPRVSRCLFQLFHPRATVGNLGTGRNKERDPVPALVPVTCCSCSLQGRWGSPVNTPTGPRQPRPTRLLPQ